MALKAADPSMDSFRELVVEKLGVPVPTFHTRWLMGQLVVLSRALNFSSVELLIDGLREESAGSDLWSEVAHAITVHETHWLRNAAALKTAVRSFGSDVAQLRILSLGCAYGQEAYSAYLVARQYQPEASISVVGVDLSAICVESASRGRFRITDDFEALLPLLREEDGFAEGECYQFSEAIRGRVTFCQGNLMDPYVAKQGAFDLILCQNCLTYYDPETRTEVSANLVNSLDAGGLLVFAGAELMGICPSGAVPLSDEWAQILVKGF